MPFSWEDKTFDKVIEKEKLHRSRYFMKEFPNGNWTLSQRIESFVKKNR